MDLMFAAEQYAQAQAAAQAVAAAQYYANMTAAAVVSAGQQPPPPPGSMASVTAPQNFSPLGLAVSEELTDKQKHKLTDILLL